MIVRIEGRLEDVGDGEVVVSVGGIAYQLLVPEPACNRLRGRLQETVSLHTLYYIQGFGVGHMQPVLLGFETATDREFFRLLTTVDGLGPRAALRLLREPVADIARAIEHEDDAFLRRLPGLGKQRAREVIAKLRGKVAPYALAAGEEPVPVQPTGEVDEEVLGVLLQLGYSEREAQRMLADARGRRQDLHDAEELIHEIFARAAVERGPRGAGEESS